MDVKLFSVTQNKEETPKYWCYMNHLTSSRNQDVRAKLISPLRHLKVGQHESGFGFPRIMQSEPYGIDLEFVYQVNGSHPHPDNYFESHTFWLFSEKLVSILQKFGVKHEIFPVTMIDRNENILSNLKYYVFHSMEGQIDAMDHERSEWKGDPRIGVPHLELKDGVFEPRPIFICQDINVKLIRDDLKQEFNKEGVTGFKFLNPKRYATIHENGMYPKIWDVEWDD